jgi:hypothetical protein
MGNVVRSLSPGSRLIEFFKASCWAMRKRWVRTAAFGAPVPPLVNVINAGSSGEGRPGRATALEERPSAGGARARGILRRPETNGRGIAAATR